MLDAIALDYVILHDFIYFHILEYNVILCHCITTSIQSHHLTLCYIILYCIMLNCNIPSTALCSIVLWCSSLGSVVSYDMRVFTYIILC